ncbi:T9SS type A sorting domain-containing protein [Hymenobacter profundi]|uniref:T9SS type A sorting domain-containing protein n=1 Tax=Hymenobacter profundi TaxID=1982110 RepID=A0ABS6X087_9BACT|nr:T9SS type A sorting domain-containing protein [Hymenobacter profundi]MBW3129262.1 T9SS type A sorting domain-containing protein [Hymenobacter profundi]
MNYLLRVFCFLLLLTALAVPSRAQTVRPLEADPARTTNVRPRVAQRPALVSLPFFDDFTLPVEGAPSLTRWLPGGALVNNRFPVAPPSRGVATLDGLSANGQPYGPSTAYNDTDTLTSQPVDLAGLTAADNVYLSFYWQAGSIVGAPQANSGARPVYLQLEFLDRNQAWQVVWQQLSTGVRTTFQEQFFAVNTPAYLHGSFQFRFRAVGNLATTRDAWSIDYVRLDRNRSATDNSIQDIATSVPLNSLLKRYAAMPVWQYNAAANPTDELNNQVTTTANNFDAIVPTPVPYIGTVQVLPNGAQAVFLNETRSLDASARQFPITGSLRSTPLPLTAEPKRVRHQVVLNTSEATPRTLPNDTIYRVTELNNYYAYDDGSAEATFNVPRGSTGPAGYFVYRIDLNKSDQLQGLRLYPLPSPTATSQGIVVAVWNDNQGKPDREAIATRAYAVPTTLPAGQQYVDVNFAAPVPVSGTFYVGFAPTSDFLNFGADLNSSVPTGYLLSGFNGTSTSQGTWNVATAIPAYAPMMRPLLTNGITTATTPAGVAASLTLYPNPSAGRVRVEGRYQSATVLDALGRVVWQQPVAQAGQATLDLQALPAGLYLIRLTLPDGSTIVTKRLVISKS